MTKLEKGKLLESGKSESEAETVRKVPVLGDIPLLGKLFSAQAKADERTELVFFLTPRIVRDNNGEN